MNRILVVDDSLSVRKALEKFLNPHAGVSLALNAEDALAQVRAGLLPHLVITDVLMPGMSGFDLARELRRLPQTASTPVILISGVIDDEVHRQVREVGGFAVVRKPFTSEELLPIIRQALGEPSAAESAGTGAEPRLPDDSELVPEPAAASTAPDTAVVGGSAASPPVPAPESPPAFATPADTSASPEVTSVPQVATSVASAGASAGQALAAQALAAQVLAAQVLVDTLTQKPGVLGALVTTRGGVAEQRSGNLNLEPADLAMYARFFVATAATLGGRLQGGLGTGVQLEFEERTLLILPYREAHLLICLLADANSSSMVKFTLRRQSGPPLQAQ